MKLDDLWFGHSLANYNGGDATCPKCKRIMKEKYE